MIRQSSFPWPQKIKKHTRVSFPSREALRHIDVVIIFKNQDFHNIIPLGCSLRLFYVKFSFPLFSNVVFSLGKEIRRKKKKKKRERSKYNVQLFFFLYKSKIRNLQQNYFFMICDFIIEYENIWNFLKNDSVFFL